MEVQRVAQGLMQRNFHAHLQERKCERMLELSHDQPYGPCQQGPVSRIQLKYLSEINEEQSGIVKGKGTREQMINIRIIM